MRSFSGVRLLTPRLELRPLRPGDEAPLFRMHADAEFMRYWSSAPWPDPGVAQRMIASDAAELASGLHMRVGIVRRDDSALIGTCSLFRFDEQNRRAEVGYGIARECWRQGYMSEAVGAVLDFAFDGLGLIRLEADIDPRNVASGRSLEKLGFVREGYLRQRWIVAGEVCDSILYGLLADDHRRRKAAPGSV